MQELKIVCQCGQKYKFDVEPVSGKMPFTVQCPICKVDGTGRANELLAQQFAVPPKPALPPGFTMVQSATAGSAPPPPPVAPAPPPPRPVSAAAPMPVGFNAPPPPPPSGLSINRPPPPVVAAPPLVAAGMGEVAQPPPIPTRAMAAMPQVAKAKAAAQFNLMLGIVGAVTGALVGCGLMYAFWIFAGFRFPIMGVAVGVTAGLAARWLGKGGDATLAIITAVLAAGSVAGTLFFMYGEFPILSIISVIVAATMANRIVNR